MAHYSERLLEEIRVALPVLAAVASAHKLRKTGAHEYHALDDKSLTVNSAKNIWNDFGKGKRGGDIFAWEMHVSGCSFTEAVERLAAKAGIALPKRASRTAVQSSEPPPPATPTPDHGKRTGDRLMAKSGPSEPVATYDYQDADGGVVYQVARFESIRDGRRVKQTMPRRRAPDDAGGGWVWGLNGGIYLHAPNGDWYFATDERVRKWPTAATREFERVAKMLYRLPQLLEETAQDIAEQRTILIPEGEKDVDTLAAWGYVATTNSGGTGGWERHFADYFANADVVVLMDNDPAGRAFGNAKAAALKPVARRVRVLDWREHWNTCPDHGDVTDWAQHGKGDAAKLAAIIDRLVDWSPQPPDSQFNAQRFIDIDRPARELQWLIKGILTRGEVSIWFGQWGSGKSFLITDAALAIARGTTWFGFKTIGHPGLVIYQAGEGGLGLRKRLRAYRQHHKLAPGDDLPFVLLPSRVDIFNSDDDTVKLIAEIKAWSAFYDVPLELVVIDTLNASAPGADENASRDIGPVLNRARRISLETGAHVALVDHTPKDGGSPRGWSGKMGNVDNALAISKADQIDIETTLDGHLIRREIREFTLAKQKDEADRLRRTFVLKRVVLGKDADGDEISSCIVAPLAAVADRVRDEIPAGWAKLHSGNEDIFRALVRALRRRGRLAPSGIVTLPGAQCVTIQEWQDELLEQVFGHEEITEGLQNRIRGRIYRAAKAWMPDRVNLIDKSREWVWRTTRKVHLIDEPPPRLVVNNPEPAPLLSGQDDRLEDLQ